MSLHSSKEQIDVALKTHVASVYFMCFRCFRVMLQMFYVHVIKVDRLHMLQRLYTYVSIVCSKYFICFRRMLQVFHVDVAYISKCFRCFHKYIAIVSSDICNSYTRVFKFF
jgi:hypothetical protein